MKLRYIYLFLMSMPAVLPVTAQVRLDSAEVARSMKGEEPKALIVATNEAEDEAEEDDDSIASFQNDSALSWQEKIKVRLDGILQGDLMETTQVGVQVWDLTADSCLYAYRQRAQLRPGSTMKLITAITALCRLGADYSFSTRIYYTGTIDDSLHVLNGDIYCVGGMDPKINSRDITAIAESVRDLGITTIKGNFYADLSFKDKKEYGSGWCWDDKNPLLTPLLAGRHDNFITQLRHRLRAMGIGHEGSVNERTLPKDAQLITTRFHSIEEVMHRMMKESDNLYAEAIFYQIAAAGGGAWSSARKAREETNKLIRKLGLNPYHYHVADGSGLSLYNYVSPELVVRMLRHAYKNSDIYNTLIGTLPIAGVDGTLRKRMRHTSATGNVRAKTGTLKGVSSLAGYLTASNGHSLCFAIILNGGMYSGPARRLQNKICIALTQ